MKNRKILWGVVSCLMALSLVIAACTPKPTPTPTPIPTPPTPIPAPVSTPPTVSSTTPANGATGTAINAAILAVFTEAMDPLTVTTTTFTLKQGTTPVTGAVTYAGVTATFAPAASLASSTEYTATITTGVKDRAGNALASNKVWTFRTASGAAAQDTTVPILSSTIPANGVVGVAVNRAISIAFSEAMNPLTLTSTTFTLKQGNTPVSGTVTYAGVTATFTPAGNLAYNTQYTATITTGAKDLAGNAMFNNREWTFTTGSAPDTTAPTVSSTIPVNTATGVAVNSAISATLSEAMDPLTITTATFTLMQGTTSVAGAVTYVGLTAIFTPDSNLAASVQYTATITTGAKDLAGNALAGNYVWTFTPGSSGGGGGGGGGGVVDTTAPTVSSTVPANAATGVSINSAISATFSEALLGSTVTTLTFTLMQGATPVNGTVSYAGVTAIFLPDVLPLTASANYTATITTAVTDLAGNHLAVNKVWTFTTGVAPDTTAPTVSSTIPANAAIGVAVDSLVSAVFNEAMIAGLFTPVTFTLKQDGITSVNGTVNYVGFIATFSPSANLTASTNYTATITTTVTDLAGNALAVNKVWSFRTGVTVGANPTAPVLGEAGRFVILASQLISKTVSALGTVLNGDMGIIDQARTFITGFTASGGTGNFTQLINGVSYAPDDNNATFPYPLKYATAVIGQPWATTLAMITQTRTDLGIAYTFLAADPNPGAATQVLASPNLGGLTLTRGVYKTAVDITIPTALHLSGNATDIFIFTTDGNLTTGATGNIFLDGTVQAKNVYWRVAGITTIAAGTNFYGNVLGFQQINVLAGANVTGRLFSVNEQVTLIDDTVTKGP